MSVSHVYCVIKALVGGANLVFGGLHSIIGFFSNNHRYNKKGSAFQKIALTGLR